MSYSIVDQVRLYIAVYVRLLLYLEPGRESWLFSQRPQVYSTQFVLLANFSLWFMLLLIHKVATYIT